MEFKDEPLASFESEREKLRRKRERMKLVHSANIRALGNCRDVTPRHVSVKDLNEWARKFADDYVDRIWRRASL